MTPSYRVSAPPTLLAALMPVAMLVTGGTSGLFYTLLLACLIVAVLRPADTWRQLRPYGWLILALCLPLAAAVFSQAFTQTWRSSEIERALRISLGFPILLAGMLAIDRRVLRHHIWGVLLAGAGAFAIVLYLSWPTFGRPLTPQFNAVTYGNLMLLAGVLALYSLEWQLTRRPALEKAIKLTVGAAAFAGFILTQTRTGWMAVPVFAAIALALSTRVHHPLRALAILASIVVALVALGAASSALRERVAMGFREVEQCQSVDQTADTSMCIRLQLWRSAWAMFEAQPATGVGNGVRFTQELKRRADEGKVSAYVAEGFGEAHNDMLMAMALHGIPGALAMLALYLAPAWVFLRRMRRDHPQAARTAAAMGLAVCLGFALFGLTELMFRGMRSLGFYVTMMAVLLALSRPDAIRDDTFAPSRK
ncbi:O-antigen ligase family protein [Bordetella genomosp. 13]|uniref:O-antigen ligase-related domain-containing protein n=1 Tax=Bordetella genomosp. 13 TaxID=463040 RepID=A0A1W6ZI00_9BORD|nr:O-antigen ligase family protein [Bordetella genomosp. 13]ARP96986.1 hypothetical protein CAL15_23000 [Bordetella genomosp. 13]